MIHKTKNNNYLISDGGSDSMNDIVIQNNNPMENIRQSTDVAGACKEIVSKTAIKIQNKKYVPVEGWMSIATAHGCVLSASDVKQIEGGISAKGIVRRVSDGLIIGEAEGFVGDDEKTWASRPLFARRAMAQTRAMSRAARSVFAHVVVLMDAGLETTPMEEMEHLAHVQPVAQPEVKQANKPIKSGIEETFSKFKTAISECLITLNLDRFIKAYKTFDKYVQTLPEDLFDEFDHYMTKAITQICEGIETGDYNVNELMRDDLIKLFPTWKNEISRVYNNQPKKDQEERIF
jgi:hypothetical protein